MSFMKISPISAIKLHIISLSMTASSYVTPTSVGTSHDRGAVLGYTIKEDFFLFADWCEQHIPVDSWHR